MTHTSSINDEGFYDHLAELEVAGDRGGSKGAASWMWLGLDEGIGVVMLVNGEPWVSGPKAVRAFFRIKDRLYREGRRIAAR